MPTLPWLWCALAACVGGPPTAPGADKADDTAVHTPETSPPTGETGATTETTPTGETGTTPTDPEPTGPDVFEDSAQADFLLGQPDGTAVGVAGVSLDPATPAGTFRSRVFDAGRLVRIERIDWLPDAPYGKPLPDGTTEVGYPGGGIDMQGTALLLHFDDLVAPVLHGAVVTDSSGAGNDAFAEGEGGVAAGPLGLAYEDEVDSWLRVPITANHELQFGIEDFTWSYWLKTTQSCPFAPWPSGNRVHLGAEETADDTTHVWLGCLNSEAASCIGVPDGTGRAGGTLRPTAGESLGFCGATPINDGQWHHVALVKAGHTQTTLSLYVDGTLDGQVQGVFTAPITFESEVDWAVGAFSRGTYQAAATLDEVAIVRRAWTADEVLDAFRRGRTSLTLAVRACNLPGCSDDPPFSAPVADPAQGLTVPVSLEVASATGQYLQYEATFSSQALPVVPLLRQVTLHVVE